MIVVTAPILLAAAAIISGVATLIWSKRRRAQVLSQPYLCRRQKLFVLKQALIDPCNPYQYSHRRVRQNASSQLLMDPDRWRQLRARSMLSHDR